MCRNERDDAKLSASRLAASGDGFQPHVDELRDDLDDAERNCQMQKGNLSP